MTKKEKTLNEIDQQYKELKSTAYLVVSILILILITLFTTILFL